MSRPSKISERRACSVLDQPRSTQRLVPAERPADKPLVQRMLELVRVHPRFGYRRIWALLRAKARRVNRKRVYRLWHSANSASKYQGGRRRNAEGWDRRRTAVQHDVP